ncbi:MAG TPA: hypothetical protein PKW95_19940 [bacterium]|mgnify:CR=1 FL=1|nr:hypothetical protein [bacterium]
MNRPAILVWLLGLIICLSSLSACPPDDDDDDDDNDAADDDAADDDATDDDTSDDDTTDDDTGDDDTGDDDTFDPNEPNDEIGVFVDNRGSDDNPGTMASPKRTVQAGADLALTTGKVVFVAEGIYQGNSSVSVSLYGGYQKGTWQRDVLLYQSKLWDEHNTPLLVVGDKDDALIVVDGFIIDGGMVENDSCGVRILDANVRLSGNSITAQSISGQRSGYTIGVSIIHSQVEMRDNIVVSGSIQCATYCVADADSVAVNSFDSTLKMTHNQLLTKPHSLDAFCASGYALRAEGGAAHLAYNQFYATANPVYTLSVTYGASLTDCDEVVLIANRFHAFRSIGAYALSMKKSFTYPAMKVTAINNLFHGGGTTEYGGLVEATGGIELTLLNNVIELHERSTEATGVDASSLYGQSPRLTVRNNTFDLPWGTMLLQSDYTQCFNATQVNGCAWAGCDEAGDNLAGHAGLQGIYDGHLVADSMCIDAGINPSPWYGGAEIYVDMDGQARPHGDAWDIGMDEYYSK